MASMTIFDAGRTLLRRRYLTQCQPLLQSTRLFSTSPSVRYPTTTDPIRDPDSADVSAVPPILRPSGSVSSATSTTSDSSYKSKPNSKSKSDSRSKSKTKSKSISSSPNSANSNSAASTADSFTSETPSSIAPKSLSSQLASSRQKGKVKHWVDIEQEILKLCPAGEPHSSSTLTISPLDFDQALSRPISSHLDFHPNFGHHENPSRNSQWRFGIGIREINKYKLQPDPPTKSTSRRLPFGWSRQISGLKTTPPPSISENEVGLFAPPQIRWKTWNGAVGNLEDSPDMPGLKLLPQWMSWTVVQVGLKLKEMGPKEAEKVDIVDLLRSTFASEAKVDSGLGPLKSGRPRGGATPPVSFRLQWNKGKTYAQLVLQTKAPPGEEFKNRRRITGQIHFDGWEYDHAYEALHKLNAMYDGSGDIDAVLGEWATWADEKFGIGSV